METLKTKNFISGRQTLKLGRFLRISNKRIQQPFTQNETSKTIEDLSHIYTLEGVEDIYRYQVNMIKGATKSINLVSFVFDDGPLVTKIVNLLIDKYKQGVDVKVFTTLKPNDFKVDSIAASEEIDFNQHMKVVKQLARHGIRIRARRDCHGKFCVVDRKYSLISSSNLTDYSYNRNPEFGCYYQNKTEVLKLACIFEHLWEQAYEFYVKNDLGNFFIQERKPEIEDYKQLFAFTKSHDEYEILYTYVENTKFSETVTNLFRLAQNEIIISTYLVRALENISVGIELLNALDRGVKVSIITRPANRRADHLEGCQQLFNKGATIYGNLYNHAKIFTIDGRNCVIFTGNLDGVHGIENGIEFGILLKNPYYIDFPMDYNQYLLEQSEFIFTNNVTLEELSKTQQKKINLGKISLCIPEELNTGRAILSCTNIFESIGNDEIRVSYQSDKRELNMITPEFALIFHEKDKAVFHLSKFFHSKHSVYQNISKELDTYLIDTNVEVRLLAN